MDMMNIEKVINQASIKLQKQDLDGLKRIYDKIESNKIFVGTDTETDAEYYNMGMDRALAIIETSIKIREQMIKEQISEFGDPDIKDDTIELEGLINK